MAEGWVANEHAARAVGRKGKRERERYAEIDIQIPTPAKLPIADLVGDGHAIALAQLLVETFLRVRAELDVVRQGCREECCEEEGKDRDRRGEGMHFVSLSEKGDGGEGREVGDDNGMEMGMGMGRSSFAMVTTFSLNPFGTSVVRAQGRDGRRHGFRYKKIPLIKSPHVEHSVTSDRSRSH